MARVRVEGRGYGIVRVGRERRWVWGSFDESFPVVVPESGGDVRVSVTGFTGPARQMIPCPSVVDVDSPPVAAAFPTLRSTLRAPKVRSLVYRGARVPAVAPLQISSSTSRSTENESTP